MQKKRPKGRFFLFYLRKTFRARRGGERFRPPGGRTVGPTISFLQKETVPPGGTREKSSGVTMPSAPPEAKKHPRHPRNRGISAEMQCGTASRAARDLPARPVPRKTAGAPGMERPESIPLGSPPRTARRGMEPCSPVNPFFLDGERPHPAPLGVQGADLFFRSGTHPRTPWRFLSWTAPAARSLFAAKREWGAGSSSRWEGKKCGLWPQRKVRAASR